VAEGDNGVELGRPPGRIQIVMDMPLSGIDMKEDAVETASGETVQHFVPPVLEQDESITEELTKEPAVFYIGDNIIETRIKGGLSPQDRDRLEVSFLERQVDFSLHLSERFDGLLVQGIAGSAAEVAGSVGLDRGVRDFPRRILQWI